MPNEALAFEYRLEESIPLGRVAPRNLERWAISVFIEAAAPEDERAEIGSANALVVTLANGDVDAPASHLLVLDRVWLRPDRRGDGLGPIIAAAVVARLGRGCHLAACYPAPFEGVCEPADRAGSIEALGRIWSQAGFQYWGDGVWMLDPAHQDSRGALDRLIADRTKKHVSVSGRGF